MEAPGPDTPGRARVLPLPLPASHHGTPLTHSAPQHSQPIRTPPGLHTSCHLRPKNCVCSHVANVALPRKASQTSLSPLAPRPPAPPPQR